MIRKRLKSYVVTADEMQRARWEEVARQTGFDSVEDWLSVAADREVRRLGDIADESDARQVHRHPLMGARVSRVMPDDIERLYRLASRIPELQASALSGFMGGREFARRLLAPNAISLKAENAGRLWGFIYATVEGPTVYVWQLGVTEEFRGAGIGTQLLGRLFKEIPPGTQSVGGFAYAPEEVTRVTLFHFLDQHGFTFGRRYIWVDKVI